MGRFLTFVEWLGNLLPHPVTLFAIFAAGALVVSAVASYFGLSVEDPRPGHEGEMLVVTNLLSGEGIRWIGLSMVTNFSGCTPLGTVLVALLGVGVAEKSGLLTAVVRALVLNAPRPMVTMVVVFAGVVSNTASEMGYVVLIPLAMAIYHSLGRHPFAGLAAAFSGVSAGYSANILVGTVDPLLAGITEEAAQLIDPAYSVNPMCNYFFMAASTLLITFVGWAITEYLVEPRLGTFDESQMSADVDEAKALEKPSALEWRGLRWAGFTALLISIGIFVVAGPAGPFGIISRLLGWLPGWGLMRNPDPAVVGANAFRPLLRSVVPLIVIFFVFQGLVYGRIVGANAFRPLLRSVVPLIVIFFVFPGFVYGRIVGTMKNDRDAIDAMAGAMRSMGLYIVLVFFASQFVAFFGQSGMGSILAVLGADLLVTLNLDNPLGFLPFILMCCFVNLMLGSASAQWAVTAPIFVPMLMQIGYSPEVIQAAYRIGDSTTNIITPMMSYFGLILAVATRYKRDLGIGTLVATMLPYSMAFLVAWTIFFYLWVFVLGIPVGPGSPTAYIPAG